MTRTAQPIKRNPPSSPFKRVIAVVVVRWDWRYPNVVVFQPSPILAPSKLKWKVRCLPFSQTSTCGVQL